MTTNKNLLVELFVEELPPKSLKKFGESFAEVLADSLRTQGLVANDAIVTAYASPRRLAAHITNVASQSPSKEILVKLMPKKVGLNESSERTDALNKRLSKEGYLRDDHTMHLEEVDEKGVVYVALRKTEQPLPLAVALQQALGIALFKLPIAKMMTYQRYPAANKMQWTNNKGEAISWVNDSSDPISWVTETVHFVRPAHSLVALYGTDVVPVTALSLTAGRETQGHRFEASVAKVVLKDADSYETQMENEGAVIPSFEKRRAEIVKQITDAATNEKLTPVGDDDLLDEVTALVERPNVLVGTFDKEFLEVPQECLILTMKANQKYFPLLDVKGKLTNKFLIVSNIRPADPSLVIAGNERVVRPRLADAKFFFDKDRKQPLDSRVLGLAKVVYHNKLGTQGERSSKVEMIAVTIAASIGGQGIGSTSRLGSKAGEGRPAYRHGGRIPRTARHHGTLLRTA